MKAPPHADHRDRCSLPGLAELAGQRWQGHTGARAPNFVSGEGGIRTRGTVSGTHDFQSCTFNHSVTPPAARFTRADPRLTSSLGSVMDQGVHSLTSLRESVWSRRRCPGDGRLQTCSRLGSIEPRSGTGHARFLLRARQELNLQPPDPKSDALSS